MNSQRTYHGVNFLIHRMKTLPVIEDNEKNGITTIKQIWVKNEYHSEEIEKIRKRMITQYCHP